MFYLKIFSPSKYNLQNVTFYSLKKKFIYDLNIQESARSPILISSYNKYLKETYKDFCCLFEV